MQSRSMSRRPRCVFRAVRGRSAAAASCCWRDCGGSSSRRTAGRPCHVLPLGNRARLQINRACDVARQPALVRRQHLHGCAPLRPADRDLPRTLHARPPVRRHAAAPAVRRAGRRHATRRWRRRPVDLAHSPDLRQEPGLPRTDPLADLVGAANRCRCSGTICATCSPPVTDTPRGPRYAGRAAVGMRSRPLGSLGAASTARDVGRHLPLPTSSGKDGPQTTAVRAFPPGTCSCATPATRPPWRPCARSCSIWPSCGSAAEAAPPLPHPDRRRAGRRHGARRRAASSGPISPPSGSTATRWNSCGAWTCDLNPDLPRDHMRR